MASTRISLASLATRRNGSAIDYLACSKSFRSRAHAHRHYSIVTRQKGEAASPKKEKVVILGSGWAGYAFARTLDPAKFERIVISPRSYFVFTPLLASTAAGTLEFRAVLEPIRRLRDIKFYQGWADDIDFGRKTVRVEANTADDLASKTIVLPAGSGHNGRPKAPGTKGEVFDVSYDKLVVACGAYSQTFGIEGVREHAHFLRDIGDARRIRLRVLSLFEQCSHPSPTSRDVSTDHGDTAAHLTDAEKRSLLHFAIVGGGPTGIEFAAELHDLIYEDLARIYPNLLRFVRITVYDVAPKLLPMFDQALATYAAETFARQGITVRTETHLDRIRLADGDLGSEHGGLRLKVRENGDEEVDAGLVVWSTGLMQNPLVQRLADKTFTLPGTAAGSSLVKDSRTGGLVTDAYLRARINPSPAGASSSSSSSSSPGDASTLDDVFVIGDCAVADSADKQRLPQTAQVASQQAVHLAKLLNKGDVTAKSFRFRNWGTMTYLGSWKAIHQSSADELKGRVAWIVWRGAYLTKSMSLRNKIMVPVYWMISWIFGRDISRF